MITHYIFSILSVVFLFLAAIRITSDRGQIGPASKTWLIIGVIFGAVSLWLWFGQPH